MIRSTFAALYISALAGAAAFGQQTSTPVQTQSDDYTRYELLAPGSGKFRIYYEVTATTAGVAQFFNPIRKGASPATSTCTIALPVLPSHSTS